MKLLPLMTLILLNILLLPHEVDGQATTESQKNNRLIDWVNPFIGTAPLTDPDFIGYTPPEGWRVWAGLTYPGSSLPNAMVQLSPITEYGTGAGYQYEDSVIYAFTHTNKGHWNYCNIPVLPVSGDHTHPNKYGSRFRHDRENAQPGYYQVYLEDYAVDVELTSTLRSGFHKYNFKHPTDNKILFDLGKANNEVTDWGIRQKGEKEIEGFQRNGEQIIHFYATLNVPIQKLEVNQPGTRKGNALVHLGGADHNVEMKIGLSFVSAQNAKENHTREIATKTFDAVKSEAAETWEKLLSNIKIEGGSDKQKEMFYTSLYRSFLWPALRSDVNGEFQDIEGNISKADFRYYTRPSLWDTYRNKLVLMTIIAPDVTADVIRSMHHMGEKTGFIPTFFHGDHAAPFITGAYKRGIKDFDVKSVYQLLLRNANVEGGIRPFISEYIEKGYVSSPDIEKPHVETKAKAGVSKTLEYAYDDYSLAQLALIMEDDDNYHSLMKRSQNYVNVFDKSTNFMRGRLSDGTWVKNFDPQYPYYEYTYREANAWQLSFYVPHDMEGLVQLYGGASAFEAKLDSLFTVPWNPDHIARNVSSFIGQYCVGNQPDHEAPFSYHFIGKPEKSQLIIDNVLNNFYGVGEHGLALPGMDDAGEMSSWYVFASLGIYPLSPADDEYIVTVPLFDSVRWQLEQNRTLNITNSSQGRNMKGITVDGNAIKGYFISHELFNKGGDLQIITD
ncbi:GH92 family glycosyl hydrolase [Anditalea andensis]|uniref:Alpha-mannosidase n=1 Tax=Anditalea andensis TaxID=1048983 RepID=A0A074KUC4_9BACT|nr:GH92 family glycosyl hydrolase [Anditalea andensis]KEO71870.1 alpha-mannosidase [Anditalea andensis]